MSTFPETGRHLWSNRQRPRPTGLNDPSRLRYPARLGAPVGRRQLLRMFGFGGAAVAGGSLLAACGTEGTGDSVETGPADVSTSEKIVHFSNWPLYIDTDDDGAYPTLEAFEQDTGVSVDYVEEINGNPSFFAKIRPQLSSGQPTGSDIIVLTNDWAGHMIELGWLQQLDRSNIPNASNLLSSLASPPFDPERDYTLPWQSGMVGIGTNTTVTGREITTVEELFTAPDLKGKVSLLTEMTDTMTLIMLELGIDPVDFSADDYDRALSKLEAAITSGQIRQFTGNEYAPELAKGNIAACFAWSGDVVQLEFDDPEIRFAIPEAGGYIFSDNMQIPILATHKANAERLMNYFYDPGVAAEVAAWVNYICPVDGAKEAMADIDPSLVDNELIFPSEATMSKLHDFKLMEWDEREKLVQDFSQTIGL